MGCSKSASLDLRRFQLLSDSLISVKVFALSLWNSKLRSSKPMDFPYSNLFSDDIDLGAKKQISRELKQ